MTKRELQYLVFELLFEKLTNEPESPTAFVGIQGDNIVVMQSGGEHLGIVFVPATASVPA